MDLRQLQYFVAVAETLSFTRASEILYVSQPTLSNQISELERELGAELLIRTKRSVMLTPVGAAFLKDARELLRRSDCLVRSVKDGIWSPMETGHLHIGYEPAAVESPRLFTAITKALRTMRFEHSASDIFFHAVHPEMTGQVLRRSFVDLVLSMKKESEIPDNHNHFLLEEQELLLITYHPTPIPDTKEAVLEILSRREIFLEDKAMWGLTDIMQTFSDLGVTPKIRFVEKGRSIDFLVCSGEGAILLPSGSYKSHIPSEDLQILHFDTQESKLGVWALWDPENINPLIQLFFNLFKEVY